jgi:uncharacterized protein YjbI with pentapeptide repeats
MTQMIQKNIMRKGAVHDALAAHCMWLDSGPGGVRADFTGAALNEVDLRNANLRKAVLASASLREANLSGADLSGCNLAGADLCNAVLIGADLSGADLTQVNLESASLADANLSEAILRETLLPRANLRAARMLEAVIEKCSFRTSVLESASVQRAKILETDFTGALTLSSITRSRASAAWWAFRQEGQTSATGGSPAAISAMPGSSKQSSASATSKEAHSPGQSWPDAICVKPT